MSNKKYAVLITPEDCELVVPANGEYFTLEELQEFVGGYIEIIPDFRGEDMFLVANEEGKLHDLPFNPMATVLANPSIVGNALYCPSNLIR